MAAGAQTANFGGYVYDARTREPLAGALVATYSQKSSIANAKGMFRINLAKGRHTIQISYLGYQTLTDTITLQDNTDKNYYLQNTAQEIEQVIVSAERRANIERTEMSVEKLSIATIKRIPALMGEVDVLKAIMLLPGVQPAAEGTSAFSVRGGSPDQNLILLDNATIYNASHLMGFFSVFNNDAIEDVKLYKGDIPASYGGRLSSLLLVNSKDGDMENHSITGGVGLISSRVAANGPIVPNKLSYMVAGRRTYADLFLPLAPENFAAVRNAVLHFYDLNGKLTYRPTARDRITFSAYRGSDAFGMGNMANMTFTNQTYSGIWTHTFSDRLFSNVSLIGSSYDYNMLMGMAGIEAGWHSFIRDAGVRTDFTLLYGNGASLHFGASSVARYVSPDDSWMILNEQRNEIKVQPAHSLESSIYVMNEHQLGDRLTIKYGLRASLFNNVGPVDSLIVYDQNTYQPLPDLKTYGRGKFYNYYWGLEPRIGAVFLLAHNNSLKAAYSRTLQFMHLLSNSTAGSPLDVWMPSSLNIQPQSAHQGSLGYFQNFLDDAIETSGEVFYKYLTNVVDFRDHARIMGNNRLEGEVRHGVGYSYGIELMARKNTGNFTGWVSYTYARSYRKVATVNSGEWYQASFDRPHNINIVASYDITKRINLSANWTYATGMPATYPIGRYEANGTIVPIYGKRNTNRYEDYHRLDLALNFELNKHKHYQHEINISVYNAYARHNTWYLQFNEDENNVGSGIMTATKVYLFSIVPSITYNFKFK